MSDDFCRLVADHLRDEDVKEERTSLVYTIVGALCFFFLLALAATWPTNAHAADTFRLKGNDGKDKIVIVLHEGKCADKSVLEYLSENIIDDRRFKKAHIEWDGKTYGGCWIELQGNVHAIGSDKQPIRPIPRGAFKDEAV